MPKEIIKLSDSPTSPPREWYNDWVRRNAKGTVLDVGKSRHWDYGFQTIDTDASLGPTHNQDICNSNLAGEYYDTVLCNGMYEFVSDPQKMVDEVYRILSPGGKAIFGFVGKNYKPYKTDWKYFDDNLDFKIFEIIERKDVNDNEYHFIVAKKLHGQKNNNRN
jgi:SAM-dependent methyltransferase